MQMCVPTVYMKICLLILCLDSNTRSQWEMSMVSVGNRQPSQGSWNALEKKRGRIKGAKQPIV